MISIINKTNTTVDKKLLTAVAKKVLKGENTLKKDISVVFLNKQEIAEINKKYRGKNEPTDVLSFEGTDEIVICPEMTENILLVLIHGILHLLGYDHEKDSDALKMQEKEAYYLK